MLIHKSVEKTNKGQKVLWSQDQRLSLAKYGPGGKKVVKRQGEHPPH